MAAFTFTGAKAPTFASPRLGPFLAPGGNLYVVLKNSSNLLQVWRSTDNGVTWATVGSVGGVSVSATTLDCVYDGNDKIYAVWLNATFQAVISVYSISAGTFNNFSTAGTAPTVSPDVNTHYPAALCRRSDGSFVVAYQGPTHSSMGTNYRSAYYITCSAAGAWGTPVEVDAGGTNDFDFCDACVGAGNIIHIVYIMATNTQLYHRSLSSANVLDTAVVVSNFSAGYYANIFYDATLGKVVAGLNVGLAYRANSVANTTWTQDANQLSTTTSGATSNAGFAYASGKLYAFYRDTTTSDVFYNSTATTTWGTAAVQDVATNTLEISCGLITNGIGIVYNDNATVMFDSFLFSGPRPVTPATISATSTVGGSVRTTHLIKPTTIISATSTVGGGVARIKAPGISVVGTPAAPVQGAVGAAVTANWDASQPRTAGDLLIAVASSFGSITNVPTPAGWTLVLRSNRTQCMTAVFTKIATGGDAAPIMGAVTNTVIIAGLFELTGQFPGTAGISQDALSSVNSATIASITINASKIDQVPGEIFFVFASIFYSAASAAAGGHTLNNGMTPNELHNRAVSQTQHYSWVWGKTTSNPVADQSVMTQPSTNQIEVSTVPVSFRPFIPIFTGTTINAPSTVGGAVIVTHAVAGVVLATSTVSGGVGIARKITPTTAVAATSTVGGAVSKAPVKPISGVVAATSTVSGGLRVTRRITTTVIAATSTVSGSVGVQRKITPTLISATSTVSGSIRVTRAIRPTTVVAATSTVSGVVTEIHRIAGVVSAISIVSGTLTDIPAPKLIVPDLVFPTTPVLDDFNRAGTASPPSASWSHLYQSGSTVDLGLFGDGDTVASGGLSTSTWGGSYWNPSTFGPDVEVYCDIVEANVPDDNSLILTARGKTSNLSLSTFTAYQLSVAVSGYGPSGHAKFSIDRYNGGVYTSVGGFLPNFDVVSGSSIGFRIRGINPVILEAWYKPPGGNWSQVGVLNDSSAGRIQAAGNVGATLSAPSSGPAMRIDNFGGGTFVIAANVYARSIVSGAVVKGGGPHPIVPATIAATSAISGGLVFVRRLPVTTVAAISTVVGTVVAVRRVAPVTVVATSTVSGSVRALRRIAPAVVAATSTVGGLVTKAPVKPITGAVAATSTVSGSLRAIRRIPAATIAATSVVSGSIQHIATFRGASIAATSTVSGFIIKAALSPKAIVPTLISATSTMSGKVITTHRVSGAVAATSTVSGRVAAIHRLVTALVAATSSISGTVSKAPVKPVSGTIAATSTVSGTVGVRRLLVVANVAAVSTVQGLVKRAAAVRPVTVLATSTVVGTVIVIRKISGTILATSTVTGSVFRHGAQVLVASLVSATSTVSGRVTAIRRITAATVLATSTVAGLVRRLRPITPAQVSATSTVVGKLGVIRRLPLITSISATSTVTGNIRVIRRIIVPTNVFAASTVQGSVVRKIHLQIGNVLATSTVSGTIVSKTPGSIMYFHQMGTVTHGKTGRIDYTTTGNHTAGKVGRIEPLTTGRAMEEDDSLVY